MADADTPTDYARKYIETYAAMKMLQHALVYQLWPESNVSQRERAGYWFGLKLTEHRDDTIYDAHIAVDAMKWAVEQVKRETVSQQN